MNQGCLSLFAGSAGGGRAPGRVFDGLSTAVSSGSGGGPRAWPPQVASTPPGARSPWVARPPTEASLRRRRRRGRGRRDRRRSRRPVVSVDRLHRLARRRVCDPHRPAADDVGHPRRHRALRAGGHAPHAGDRGQRGGGQGDHDDDEDGSEPLPHRVPHGARRRLARGQLVRASISPVDAGAAPAAGDRQSVTPPTGSPRAARPRPGPHAGTRTSPCPGPASASPSSCPTTPAWGPRASRATSTTTIRPTRCSTARGFFGCKLLPAGSARSKVLAVGLQPGRGRQSCPAQAALAPSYGADGTLAGVIAFAPEWPTRLNSFGYVDQLENPTELTYRHRVSARTW